MKFEVQLDDGTTGCLNSFEIDRPGFFIVDCGISGSKSLCVNEFYLISKTSLMDVVKHFGMVIYGATLAKQITSLAQRKQVNLALWLYVTAKLLGVWDQSSEKEARSALVAARIDDPDREFNRLYKETPRKAPEIVMSGKRASIDAESAVTMILSLLTNGKLDEADRVFSAASPPLSDTWYGPRRERASTRSIRTTHKPASNQRFPSTTGDVIDQGGINSENEWWGFHVKHGWSVLIDIINVPNAVDTVIFYSMRDHTEFDFSRPDFAGNQITPALTYFDMLPDKQRFSEKAVFEKLRRVWSEIKALRTKIALLQSQLAHGKPEAKQVNHALDVRVVERSRHANEVKAGASNAAIAHLKKNGIFHLWHFTSCLNLDQIFKSQCLYAISANPSPENVTLLSNELSRSLDHQLGREQYVRLSFISNSFFFHAIKSPRIVWLRFSLQILEMEGVKFVKGNGASPVSAVDEDLAGLSLNWETMRAFQGHYSNEIGPVDYPRSYQRIGADFIEEKNTWNSEIMVPRSLSLSYCDGVYNALSGAKFTHR